MQRPGDLMSYLAELRDRVHRYRRYGLLPEAPGAAYLRTRRGSGLACAVCGEPVLAAEPEVIIECRVLDERALERPILRLHHLCHVIWLTECLSGRAHRSSGA